MLRDLYRTLAYRVGMKGETAEFCMGHVIDKNGYLQIQHVLKTVFEDYRLLSSYLETGVTTEQEEKIRTLEKEAGELKKKTEAQSEELKNMD